MIHNQHGRTSYRPIRESSRHQAGGSATRADDRESELVVRQISLYRASLTAEDIPAIEKSIIESAATTVDGVTLKVFRHHNPTGGILLAERSVTPRSCIPGGELAQWFDQLRPFFDEPTVSLVQRMKEPAAAALRPVVAPKRTKVWR